MTHTHPSYSDKRSIIPDSTNLRTIYLMLLTLILSYIPVSAANHSSRIDSLIEECKSAVDGRRYSNAAQKGEELASAGNSEGDSVAFMLGLCYKVNALISSQDTTDYLSDINTIKVMYPAFKKNGNKEAAAKMAQTLGKYNHLVHNAYSQSLQYYLDALKIHESTKNDIETIADLSLIAVIYLHKQEPSGWDYAIKAYNKAKDIRHKPSIYITAANMANYLCNNRDFQGAITHIKEAFEIADILHYDTERTYLNTFLGSVYESTGQSSLAEGYYKVAMKISEGTTPSDIAYAGIKYAIFLKSNGRYQEALDITKNVESIANRFHFTTFQAQLYPLVSECHEALGNYRMALDYQRKYMDVNRRIMTEEKEREFSILDLRYRISEEKRINAAQSIDLLNRKRQRDAILAIAIILLLSGVVSFIYYRKRMSSLKTIVRHHLENAESEKRLKEKYESIISRIPEPTKKQTSLDNDRMTQIYTGLESLMNEDKVYRKSDLSLEKAATMLNTNRTYLSQVVNENAGSFASYVNRYRLQEAIEILSDPKNTESLKCIGISVGFSSPSNFYTLFRQKMGMSPSLFRENVRNLSDKD